jgi:hypothetical protein
LHHDILPDWLIDDPKLAALDVGCRAPRVAKQLPCPVRPLRL